MYDFLLLLPLIIIGSGAVLLMLLSAYQFIQIETASYISMAFYGVAFFLQNNVNFTSSPRALPMYPLRG